MYTNNLGIENECSWAVPIVENNSEDFEKIELF